MVFHPPVFWPQKPTARCSAGHGDPWLPVAVPSSSQTEPRAEGRAAEGNKNLLDQCLKTQIQYVYTYIYIHYITLHYITLHYITLHYITLHNITLHYITLHYITLHTYKFSLSSHQNLSRTLGEIHHGPTVVFFAQQHFGFFLAQRYGQTYQRFGVSIVVGVPPK